VATSRRRERELARRRFERRRQAELERRAKAKRRNSILGAVIGVVAVIVVLVVVGIVAFGGSSSPKKKGTVNANSTPTPTASATSSAAPAAPTKCAKISPNPPAKGQPTVPPVTGKVSSKLVTKDVKVGTGAAAKAGASLKVDYIGISCDTGKVFDATYKDGGTPFTVSPLGTASVIQGWNEGLIGIKSGGVRELIIPAALGYGAAGSGSAIPGNDTLIFLVTAKSVTNK
jgi:peptidylprolyl isomerase